MPPRDLGRLVSQLEELNEKLGTWEKVAERIHNSETGKPITVRAIYYWLDGTEWPDKHIQERVRRLYRYHVLGHK